MKLADEAAFAELAELEPIEYERLRKGRAKDLGIRITELDAMVAELRGGAPHGKANGAADHPFEEDEPWHDPVAGDELLEVLEGEPPPAAARWGWRLRTRRIARIGGECDSERAGVIDREHLEPLRSGLERALAELLAEEPAA